MRSVCCAVNFSICILRRCHYCTFFFVFFDMCVVSLRHACSMMFAANFPPILYFAASAICCSYSKSLRGVMPFVAGDSDSLCSVAPCVVFWRAWRAVCVARSRDLYHCCVLFFFLRASVASSHLAITCSPSSTRRAQNEHKIESGQTSLNVDCSPCECIAGFLSR